MPTTPFAKNTTYLVMKIFDYNYVVKRNWSILRGKPDHILRLLRFGVFIPKYKLG